MFGCSSDEPTLNSCLRADTCSPSFRASGKSSFIATRRVVSLSMASQILLCCPLARQLTNLYLPMTGLSLDTESSPGRVGSETDCRFSALVARWTDVAATPRNLGRPSRCSAGQQGPQGCAVCELTRG